MELLDALTQLQSYAIDFLKANGFEKIQIPNRKMSVIPQDTWARLSFRPVSSSSAELGRLVIRDRGIYTISLFYPVETGSLEYLKFAYKLRDYLAEYRYNFLELGIGTVTVATATTDYYQINISTTYRHK